MVHLLGSGDLGVEVLEALTNTIDVVQVTLTVSKWLV